MSEPPPGSMISMPTVRRWVGSAAQDLSYGKRNLLRSPLATGVMIISIALGIGVATAVFTLVDVMLIRPLPFPAAERLVVPFQTVRVQARAREDTVAWTFARYELLKKATRGLDNAGFATWTSAMLTLAGEDQPVRVEAITKSLLSTFSLAPQFGRVFTEEEDVATNPATVVMISDHLWRSTFGASPDLVGTSIDVNGTPVHVVGIMPPRFTGFTIGADLWLPVRMMSRIDPSPRWTERLAAQSGTVIARMSVGTTTKVLGTYLQATLPVINDIATEKFLAKESDRGIGVTTLAEARRHPLVKPILKLMAAAVIGLLAIVCANIASILLARGHSRRGEMGVRIALGASPTRVARQILTECALLGFVALPCGILLGSFCAEALARLRPALPQNFVLLRGTDLLAGASLDPNLRILLFGSLVAAVATILFGIGPAIAASRVDAARLIATSGDLHATAPVRGRQALVISQVALATILLISAGLTLRSLGALLKVDLGFRPDGVVALQMASSDTSASARIRRRDFITHLSSMPGVASVATAGCVPFDLSCVYTLGVRAVGGEGADRPVEAELHDVSSEYLRTMGIPLMSGRTFTAEDSTAERPTVVISESVARALFGTTEALGKEIVFEQNDTQRMTIVGIARDVRFQSIDAVAAPAVYTLEHYDTGASRFDRILFVRTSVSRVAAAATVANEARATSTPMSIASGQALTDVVRAATSTTRFVAALLLGFAITALMLAGLGVYGVVAYMVSQRTKELGLRILLGADDRTLVLSTLTHGAAMVISGLGAGVVVALAASRLVASFLFGIKPLDAPTYAGVVAVVGAIGVVATLLPAWRILRIDAAATLRA